MKAEFSEANIIRETPKFGVLEVDFKIDRGRVNKVVKDELKVVNRDVKRRHRVVEYADRFEISIETLYQVGRELEDVIQQVVPEIFHEQGNITVKRERLRDSRGPELKTYVKIYDCFIIFKRVKLDIPFSPTMTPYTSFQKFMETFHFLTKSQMESIIRSHTNLVAKIYRTANLKSEENSDFFSPAVLTELQY